MDRHEHVWEYDARVSSFATNRYHCACGRWAYRTWNGARLSPLALYGVNSHAIRFALALAAAEDEAPWGAGAHVITAIATQRLAMAGEGPSPRTSRKALKPLRE